MMLSTLISSSSIEAQENLPLKNRIFPKNTTLTENRPAHRTHPYGGTLVWGTVNKPTIINPILTSHSMSMTLLDLIFNRLVRVNNKGIIESDLAKKWKISEDGLVYTFYLNEGVRFHDGVECTAEDVFFTYEQLTDPKNKSPFHSPFKLVNHFKVIDRYTFQITLLEPSPSFLSRLVREIIPKHILEGEDLYNTPFNENPIGTGPFVFKDWDKETNQIELNANIGYFEGRPYLDSIVVKTYPNVSKTWSAFMRSEIDLMIFVKQDDYSIIEHDSAFRAYVVPGSMYYAIVYNLDDPVWQDRELRKAMAHGINIEGIIDSLPRFEGMRSTGPFHPESPGYNHEVQPFKFDPVKAKMMLMHRGWQDRQQDAYDGENNIRKKNGQELELCMLVYERNATFKRMAQIIRQQLAELGVKVKIVYYQDEEELTEEFMRQNNVQVWLRLFQGLGTDVGIASTSWYSLSSEFTKFGNYKNTEIDHLFEMGKSTKDENERFGIYKQIHKLIYDDQPASFLFYPAGYFAVNSDFKNTDEYFSLFMPPYTIKDWYYSKN